MNQMKGKGKGKIFGKKGKHLGAAVIFCWISGISGVFFHWNMSGVVGGGVLQCVVRVVGGGALHFNVFCCGFVLLLVEGV